MGSLKELKDLLIELQSFVEFSCGNMHSETDDGDKKLAKTTQNVIDNFDKYKKEWVNKEVEERLRAYENTEKERELLNIYKNK